ncbi:hypothetical protein ACTXT7_001562 [Hymenolepis weldensis]
MNNKHHQSDPVEFTTLTKLIESLALEQSEKCGYVTGRVEKKRLVCVEASSANQQSRSLQPTFDNDSHNKVSNKPSPLNIFLLLTTLDIA